MAGCSAGRGRTECNSGSEAQHHPATGLPQAQVLEREQEVAELQQAASLNKAALEARLRSVEGRLAREADRCRQLEARWGGPVLRALLSSAPR